MLDDAAALDQLSAIRAMINDTRRSAAHHWVFLVIWGALGIVAAISSHLLLATPHKDAIWLVWFAYGLLGSLLSSMFGRRAERRARARTFIDRIMSATWKAVGTMIMLLWFAALIGALPMPFLPAVIVIVIASGLCVMGAVLEFELLYAAAGLWWFGAVVMMLYPEKSFALLAGLIVFGYLAPAAVLRRQVAADDALD